MPTRGYRKPGTVIVADVVPTTSGEYMYLDRWCAINAAAPNDISTGTDRDGLIAFILSQSSLDKPIWVIMYRLAEGLTLLDVWGRFGSCGDRVTWLLHSGNTTIVRCYIANCEIVWLDSRCWYRSTAEELAVSCKMIGAEPVRIVAEAIREFTLYSNIDLSEDIRFTAGSTAGSYWRHTCPSKEKPELANQDLIDWEGKAHFGGWISAPHLGRVNGCTHCLDVRSMYPAMMAAGKFPLLDRCHLVVDRPDIIERALANDCLIAAVRINTVERSYPLRMPDGNMRMQSGQFSTLLCTPELAYAHEHGDIEQYIHGWQYVPGYPFASTIHNMWGHRANYSTYNPAMCLAVKAAMNSLYGRTAQRVIDWESINYSGIPPLWGRWAKYDPTSKIMESYRSIGGHVQRKSHETWAKGAHPAIAGHITSYARVFMRELIEIVGMENIHYIHTDCLHVNTEGYSRILDVKGLWDGGLGSLRVEWESDNVVYLGPQHYMIDGRHVCAGIPANAEWLTDTCARVNICETLDSVFQRVPDGKIRTKTIDIQLGEAYINSVQDVCPAV